MIDFATNIALALIGTAIYTLWMVRGKLKVFDVKIFFRDNIPFWIWCTCFQVAMAGLVSFSPENASALKGLIGIDFSEPLAFVTSGWILSIAANSASATKIGRKD